MKLKNLIKHYIVYRRSLGNKFCVNEKYLMSFCNIIGGIVDISHPSSKQIKKFIYGKGKVTGSWFIKYTTLSGFYDYAISRGYINHSPLPRHVPKRPPPFIPHIYTREELKRLFEISLIYSEKYRYIHPYMINVLLRLLYGTGLRLGEALSLNMSDVDLIRSTILIRSTKFNKNRIIPFGKHLLKVLADYILWRKHQGNSEDKKSPFFINPHGGNHLRHETVRGIFHRIL